MVDTNQASIYDIIKSGGSNQIADIVDKVLKTTPIGQLSTSIGDNIRGINHRQVAGAMPINKDYYGMTFFTRPLMNMSTENLRAVRQLTSMLTTEATSLPRIIRCLLDPTLAGRGISSPYVDRQQAFIPILSNCLMSMSGWPDVSVQSMISHEGVYKEQYGHVDSSAMNLQAYDITANFRNVSGDPITSLFLFWIRYMSLVYEGTKMVPYPQFIVRNEIDYNTRIYRLILDGTKTKVQKIAACGAAYPYSVPIGASFNFESDRPINNSNDQITINFQCFGAEYNDDITIYEFNRVVTLFNDTMRDNARESSYTPVKLSELPLFNYLGYPRIDPKTRELQWWIANDDYKRIINPR